MTKVLMKGNHAIAQAAINAGLDCYFGYPITPQSEISEYMSDKMPLLGKQFVCAESELASINMVIGACATGAKAMSSSSSCAIALMQEALSYAAGDELPVVLISVMRAGPGLGYINPSQADFNQAVYGGGNGDYRTIVLAPSTVQECVSLTYKAFHLAQKYRNPVILLADGLLGQMMEPVEFTKYPYPDADISSWALTGAKGRPSRSIHSLESNEITMQNKVYHLFKKYEKIEKEVADLERLYYEDAELIVMCFGSLARNVKAAVKLARKQGLKVGFIRPITLYPFPSFDCDVYPKHLKKILCCEMNMGQMVNIVKLNVNGRIPVEFYGKPLGEWLSVEEILEEIKKQMGK